MDIERVLRGTTTIATVTFYNGEVAQDADGGVTVTVKNPDGTTYSTGAATHVGAAGSGQYKVTIPPQTNLNIFELVWTGTFSGSARTLISYIEVVGDFFYSVPELRAYDSALANTNRISTAQIIEKRLTVEDEFEEICRRAFVPRFHREQIDPGEISEHIYTEKPEVYRILKLTVDGVDRSGWVTNNLLRRDRADARIIWFYDEAIEIAWADQVVMEYEYGGKRVPPLIKEAAKKRTRGLLLGQNTTIDERATVMTIPEFGTFNLATPGPEYVGIPDIDAILHRHILGYSGGVGVY